MYKVEQVAFDNNFLIISFSSETEQTNLSAEFRFKDMTRYALNAFNEFFKANVISKGKTHELRINMLDFIDKVQFGNPTYQVLWLYIESNKEFYELEISKELIAQIKKMKAVTLLGFFEVKFSQKGSNKLSLNVQRKNINYYLKKISKEGNQLILELPSTKDIYCVELKKRIFKDTLIYSQGIMLDNKKENTYILNLENLNNIEYDEVTNLDFIAVVKVNNVTLEFPLLKQEDLKLPTISFSNHFGSKLYFTAKNSLSFRVEKKYSMLKLKNASINRNILTAEIEISQMETNDLSHIKCGVYRKNRLFNDDEYTLYKSVSVNHKGNSGEIELDLNEFSAYSNYDQIYSVFFSVYTKYFRIGADEIIAENVTIDESDITIKVEKDFTIDVKPKTSNPIKLSILGSCFSRAAFNSSNAFFNKDYKLYYSLEYSHFWISLISAVGPKIEFNSSDYKDLPEKVIGNIKKEYEKSTFKDLRKTNTDYVIIDLFVDAVHGVRKLSDGRFIGQNGDMHKSYYYKNILLKETNQFDYRHPDFWNTWKESCDVFIEQLENVIGRNKVILNWGGLSDGYYTESGEVSSFSKDDKKFNKTDINFINHTWEKMNNYFISKMPEAKVIKLNDYNYLASLEYPYGGSGPHHYEKNYYKSFLGELSKIVLKDKI